MNGADTTAIVTLLQVLASLSVTTWGEIRQILQLSEAEAEAARQALQADRPALEALIAHLRERVPESEH